MTGDVAEAARQLAAQADPAGERMLKGLPGPVSLFRLAVVRAVADRWGDTTGGRE